MNTHFNKILSLILIAALLLLSKEFLIFNELAIVAICFFIFIIFGAFNMDGAFKAEFDERGNVIEQEYADYLAKRQEALETVLNTYKRQLSLRSDIKEITIACRDAMNEIIKNKNEALKNNIKSNIARKLDSISRRSQAFIIELQSKLSQSAQNHLLKSWQTKTDGAAYDNDFAAALATLSALRSTSR